MERVQHIYIKCSIINEMTGALFSVIPMTEKTFSATPLEIIVPGLHMIS